MVDSKISAFDTLAQSFYVGSNVRKCIGGESVGQRVRLHDGIVKSSDTTDKSKRPERLFIHCARTVRNVGKNSQRIEIALIADASAARNDSRTFRHCISDQRVHCLHAAVVGERTHRLTS